MVNPTIDELAAPKESIFYIQTPKGGSLKFVALINILAGRAIPTRE
jgi:hypothetical protein